MLRSCSIALFGEVGAYYVDAAHNVSDPWDNDRQS